MPKLAIETRSLTRRFGDRLAVNAVDLEVPETGVYGFLGPNGAGKTTTIRMLLGLIRPDAGDVRLAGESLSENRLNLLKRVGALVETPSLYSHLTGRENLEVTRRLTGSPRRSIDRALEVVKLARDADRRVREYSLGMRQRLGLALALMNEPRLLILDEPANGLDPAGIHEMRDLIRRLPAEMGATVFLSSHLLSEIEQVADQIGIISNGRLLFQGPLSALQAERQPHLVIGVNDIENARQCLAEGGWPVSTGADGRLIVTIETQEAAAEINRRLLSHDLEVFHLALTRASLEDIFLSLTNNRQRSRT